MILSHFCKTLITLSAISLGTATFAQTSDNQFFFTCQPYLQSTGEGEITVVWGTNDKAVSWVEIAPDDGTHFYSEERPKYFDTNFGRKRVGTLHRVRINNLTPGATYRYRIYSQEVTKEEDRDTRYGRVIANKVYQAEPYRMRVPDLGKDAVHFAMVNDIHQRPDLLRDLYNQLDSASMDFIVFNGDMVNKMDSIAMMYDTMLNPASDLFARTTPFYMTRGNHETRGNGSEAFTTLFPTSTGMPFYSFTAGPVRFIVLDAGEDKPDNDIEYCGLADFDRYRTEEVDWLRREVEAPEWKNAKYRIVLIHVPLRPGGWHGEIDLAEKFLPVLNNADVDIMLSGHYHTHDYFEKGTEGRNFPLFINSDRHLLDINADQESLTLKATDREGKSVKTVRLSPKN
ncbi:MAG: metallophosphoesterase family protein [Bacteroidales bacterium]|nr:metallophosphoesterase family protein [Bacteroidales bacterium]